MKFGICVNLLKTTPTDTGIGLMGKIAAWGYDYIELAMSDIMTLSDEAFAALAEQVKEGDLPCRACNCFFPPHLKLTGEAVDQEAVKVYYTQAIVRAKALGAQYIVFGSPWSRAVPEGFSKEKAYQQLLELCREMGSVAEKNDLIIAVEHNNKTETNLLNQLHEVGKLVEEVDHPHIKVLVDYYHIKAENEPIASVVRYGDLIVHSHFARFEGRGYPKVMSEDLLYEPYINALKEIEYTGGISVEAYSEDLESEAPAALAFFKKHFL